MAYIYNLYELEDIKIGPDYSTAHGGWVPGERLQVLLYNKARGTGSRPHRHPNEQFIFVMKGRARATVEGQEKIVGPGEIVHMPANSLHNVIAMPGEDLMYLTVKDTRFGIHGIPEDGKKTGGHYDSGFTPSHEEIMRSRNDNLSAPRLSDPKEREGKVTVYKAGQVIDATGAPPLRNAAVIVEGEKIRAVCPASDIGDLDGAEVVDLGDDYTLMPGLMDVHTHLSAQNALTFNNYRVAFAELSPEKQQNYELLHAQILFEMGFTTVRAHPWPNMFAGHNSANICAVRDAFDSGIFIGPRILAGGYATMTGSHLDLIAPRSFRREPDATADGPWELRKLARQQLRLGVDFIKTCASGGGGTDAEEPEIRNMTQEELAAVAEEAHFQDKHCSCHCFTPVTQIMAIKAGVDTIEHCVFTSDEAIDLLVKHNKPVAPTLLHRSDWSIGIRGRVGTSQFTLNKMRRIQPYTEESFKRFLAAGVMIAMGTDTQIEPYMGSNAKELEIYVDFGMKPMDAIMTATRNAAKAIRVDSITGTLTPGKLADMIAVRGDPLADISILHQYDMIALVMKEGRVWIDRRPGYPRRGVVNDPEWGWKRLY